jgi:hypothetical protein
MNRQQIMTIAAVVGIIFLVFYWTHTAFNSAMAKSEASLAAAVDRIDKATLLAVQARKNKSAGSTEMSTGLLSFLQNSAESSGLSGRVDSIKPKPVSGANEAATIRLENLNYNEVVDFLNSVEKYTNLSVDNLRISKRFDNENMLNMVMDIIKR